VVPPKLTLITLTKNSLCDTENSSQRHSFQIRHLSWLYPCSITGAPELGYLVWSGRPRPYTFTRSTRRSIRLLRFCLAYTTSARLSGNRFETYSSSSAFFALAICWSVFYDGGRRLSRGNSAFTPSNPYDLRFLTSRASPVRGSVHRPTLCITSSNADTRPSTPNL